MKKTTGSRKRIQPEGCWSHCGTKCIAEELGLCRETKPPLSLAAPNEGYVFLDQLRFGKRDYTKEKEEWDRNRFLGKEVPKDWRLTLAPPDPWADRTICNDPTGDFQKTAWPYQLWDGRAFYDKIQEHPPFVDALNNRIRQGNLNSDLLYREISGVLRRFFEGVFWREVGRPTKGPGANPELFNLPTNEVHFLKAKRIFQAALTLISKWFIMDYFENMPTWIQATALYGSLGDNWQQILTQRKAVRGISKVNFKTPDGGTLNATNPSTLGEYRDAGTQPDSERPTGTRVKYKF